MLGGGRNMKNHLWNHRSLPLVTSFIIRIPSYDMCSRNSGCYIFISYCCWGPSDNSVDKATVTEDTLLASHLARMSCGYLCEKWELVSVTLLASQGLVAKLGRYLLPMVEIFDMSSIEYFDDTHHIGQHCIVIFFLKK